VRIKGSHHIYAKENRRVVAWQ